MDVFIFTSGFVIMIVGFLLFLYNKIKKRPLDKYITIMSVGFILFFAPIFMEDPKTGKPTERPKVERVKKEEVEEGQKIENEIEEDENQAQDIKESIDRIKEASIRLNFTDANNDRIEKGSYVHLIGKIDTIYGRENLDKITISTKENDIDGIYTLINHSNTEFGFNKDEFINIWGTYEGKGEDGVPQIYGLYIEKADEILEESPEEVEEKEIKNTRLFNEIYYNIANRQLGHGKDDILMKAEEEGLLIEEDEENNSITIRDEQGDEKYKEDYLYISFDNTGEGNRLISATYHHKNENIEVSFTNDSIDGDPQYDRLRNHIIDGEDKDVETLDEQIEFLNRRKILE